MESYPSTRLRGGQASKGNAGIYNVAINRRSSRRGSTVHFHEVFPPDEDSDSQYRVGAVRGESTEEDFQGAESEYLCSKRCCYSCNTLLEHPKVGRLFSVFSVLNLLSLACSSPWRVCNYGNTKSNDECGGVLIQFAIITAVDFLVSVVFSIQLFMAAQCILFRCFQDNKKKTPVQGESRWHGWIGLAKLLHLVCITASLWYSVGIGVYRSLVVKKYIRELEDEMNPTTVPVLQWYYYLPLVLRSTAAVSAMTLIAHLKIPTTALTGMLKKIQHRWKQLLYVSIFYFFNVYIYALIGVQLLGGLNDTCFLVDEETGVSLTTSIPTTHCNLLANDSIKKRCFDNPNIECRSNNESGPLNFNYRNKVYLGQYRFIVDALFAVYEASSLELWSFMQYNGLNGSPRSYITSFFYYVTMVFYLVIFVQQSIFLVVIIESFADLRSDAAGEISFKEQKKPTIVLYEQKGGTNEISFKDIVTQESLTVFKNKRQKYYFCIMEKVFICLVLVDAAIMAYRNAGMNESTANFLVYWQLAVSIAFVLEVVGLFFFHLLAMPMQLGLFFKNRYFWFLAIIAVGGMFYSGFGVVEDKMKAGNWLAVFQAIRLLRALRLVPQMKKFVSTIIGDGVRLVIIVLIVFVFLVWFAVVSMVLFGYLEPLEGCERIGSDMFRDFFHSFESMFQLLMQEGWSQLFSELQCRRDVLSYFINFYFILLHLVASLFLLNFFVAVILDNLDYDEEVKIKKLEEAEKNKERVQKVPKHLSIFQLGGPKKIPVPKLSSVDAPSLTEADVRNFYKVGEATNISSGFIATEQPPSLPSEIGARRSSKLSNLDLLMGDTPTVGIGICAHQGKYWGIQGILSHVKAFRQHSRENEGTRPSQSARGAAGGDFLGGRPLLDSSAVLIQNQYDEYREKYRLFDRALFCLPPEHKFRRFCQAVLTKQLHGPTVSPENPLSADAVIYVLRSIVSVLPFFNWFMLLITCLTLIGQLVEISVDSSFLLKCLNSSQDGVDSNNCPYLPVYFVWVDLFFVLFTLVELVLKILANGVFFNPHAAIQGLWDVLDWLIVLATLAVMITYLVSCRAEWLLRITYRNLPPWLLFLFTLRALRPLRLISLNSSIRRVMYELMLGVKKLIFAGILLLLFMFMFASLGVQIFTGEGSPEGFCNDPTRTDSNCTGVFNMNIVVSLQESLPLTNIIAVDTTILVPRVWYEYRRNFRFDNTFRAFITLFEVLTLEGWLDVRDLYSSTSDIFKKGPYSTFMFFYIHIFVFIGVNFGLQVFVGIVVNNFNENKPNHSALLTVSQKRWTDLLQRISLTRPIKKPSPPRNNNFRLGLYKIFVSSYYKHFVTVVIFVNSWLFWLPWADDSDVLERYTTVLMSISIVMAILFIIEFLLKLLAFGFKGYFQSWRNSFDFFLSLLGVSYVIMSIVYLLTDRLIAIQSIADVALIFTVLKLFTILMKYSILQNLLTTVVSTLLRSRAFLGVLISFLLAYTLVGNLYFSNLRSGEAINFNSVTFMSFYSTFSLMIRVTTGEDWHTIFQDSMVGEPYCSKSLGTCGSTLFALVFFLSFYVLVSFILLNVVIAVLLENFSIFYNEDDTELNHAVVKDFKQNWLYYDKYATGLISSGKIKLFLRMLKLSDFYTYDITENGIRERQKSNLLVDSILLREMAEELRRDRKQLRSEVVPFQGNQQTVEDKEHSIPFQDVLKMIAYRAEDISQRLVPHDLYVREELEKSFQFDVAEHCILKWIQKFVKPEKVRRMTVSHSAYRATRRDESIWPMLARSDRVEDGNRLDGSDLNTADSEDELGEPLRESYSTDHPWRRHQSVRSEDDGGDMMQQLGYTASGGGTRDKLHNPALVKSWSRLETAPYVHFKQQQQGGGAGGKDKWHEWIQMQKEWLSNVDQDPDNYFDDNL